MTLRIIHSSVHEISGLALLQSSPKRIYPFLLHYFIGKFLVIFLDQIPLLTQVSLFLPLYINDFISYLKTCQSSLPLYSQEISWPCSGIPCTLAKIIPYKGILWTEKLSLLRLHPHNKRGIFLFLWMWYMLISFLIHEEVASTPWESTRQLAFFMIVT